jgi:hypothetical protein
VVVFASALKVTVPLPVPLDPAVTVTQLAPLVAVHAQPEIVVMATLPVPPTTATACVNGEILDEQLRPDCVTVKVLPAIVSVPLREDVVVAAATAKATVPLPEPEAPPVTDSHDALLTALHAQPEPAVTATLPLPPAEATDCEVVPIDGAHGAVSAKVFDRSLVPLPPGPTADTRVSYMTPGVSGVVSSETKSRRIMPSTSSAGFWRFTVCVGCVPPAT